MTQAFERMKLKGKVNPKELSKLGIDASSFAQSAPKPFHPAATTSMKSATSQKSIRAQGGVASPERPALAALEPHHKPQKRSQTKEKKHSGPALSKKSDGNKRIEELRHRHN